MGVHAGRPKSRFEMTCDIRARRACSQRASKRARRPLRAPWRALNHQPPDPLHRPSVSLLSRAHFTLESAGRPARTAPRGRPTVCFALADVATIDASHPADMHFSARLSKTPFYTPELLALLSRNPRRGARSSGAAGGGRGACGAHARPLHLARRHPAVRRPRRKGSHIYTRVWRERSRVEEGRSLIVVVRRCTQIRVGRKWRGCAALLVAAGTRPGRSK